MLCRVDADWLPTFLAAAGDPEVKQKLLTAMRVGDKTFRTHLDGYNMMPSSNGEVPASPRHEFFFFDNNANLNALRYDDWKIHWVRFDLYRAGVLQFGGLLEPFARVGQLAAFGYTPLGKQSCSAAAADARAARGDVPFYQLPYIEMRGIPSRATRMGMSRSSKQNCPGTLRLAGLGIDVASGPEETAFYIQVGSAWR